MASLSDVTGILTLVSIVFGMAIAIIQLRNIVRERQIQTWLQLLQHTRSKDYMDMIIDVLFLQEWEEPEEWWEKYGPRKNPDATSNFLTVMSIFASMGELLRKNILDLELYAGTVNLNQARMMWRKIEPWIKQRREVYNDPNFYDSAEYLINELIKYRERKIALARTQTR